jgi:hypothetical protein
MKILSDVGFLVKVILISAVIGFGIGLYVAEKANAEVPSSGTGQIAARVIPSSGSISLSAVVTPGHP